MTNKLVALAMAGIMTAAVGGSALAENEPAAVAKGTAVLDGNAAKFVAAGAQAIRLASEQMLKDAATLDGDEGLSGVAYLMYDDAYLCLDAGVTDESAAFDKLGNKSGVGVWNLCDVTYVPDWKGAGVTASQTAAGIDDAGDCNREAQFYYPLTWVHNSPDSFATASC